MTDSASPGLSPDQLAMLFAADPEASPTGRVVALPTIPASSPIMKRLEQELRATADAAPSGSPVGDLVSRILRGQVDLRTALSDPAFPDPTSAPVDPALGALISKLDEEKP